MGIKERIEQNGQTRANTNLLNILQQNLPQFFDREGNFKIDKFSKELKADDISENRDGYRLSFVGKDYARLQTGLQPETMLAPDTEHNSKPENAESQNVFITGDNLEALRHLQNAYAGKVKMIYIDPPYNTGKEFVYNDKFEFDDDKLRTALAYSDEEIARLKSIQGKSSHSAWLTFMYPRLKIAQKLLTDDGVIFVSIDDNEQANLKLLMDDVFGEGNFEATVIPIVNPGGRDYKQIAITNEYLLIYSKTDISEINEITKDVDFSFFDSFGGFEYRELRNRNPKFHSGNRPNLFYPFYVNPTAKNQEGYCAISLDKTDYYNIEIKPYNSEGKESVWRWGKSRAKDNITIGNLDKSQILAKQKSDGKWNIYEKSRKSTTKVKSLWAETEMRTENGTREIRELFSKTLFDHPKPLALLKRCLQMGTYKDSIILDFFAGSGTTAHAVMQLNAEDGGNRKYIMVQLDEPTNPDSEARKAGYNTIDEISRERIKRAAAQLRIKNYELRKQQKEQLLFDNQDSAVIRNSQFVIDTGFRHYRLKTIETQTLDRITEFDPNENKLFEGNMISALGGLETILTTWLIDDGYDFQLRIKNYELRGYKVPYVEETGTIYLIEPGFGTEQLKELLNKIGKGKLQVNTIVVFPYSFTFEQMLELKNNVKNNLDGNINIIERY